MLSTKSQIPLFAKAQGHNSGRGQVRHQIFALFDAF